MTFKISIMPGEKKGKNKQRQLCQIQKNNTRLCNKVCVKRACSPVCLCSCSLPAPLQHASPHPSASPDACAWLPPANAHGSACSLSAGGTTAVTLEPWPAEGATLGQVVVGQLC